MLDDSLPIRSELMADRQRWMILLVSLPELFVPARIVMVPPVTLAFMATADMKQASRGGGA